MPIRNEIIEVYKGFQVIYNNNAKNYTAYYSICVNRKPVSCLALSSAKACKNVIDTHLKTKGDTVTK